MSKYNSLVKKAELYEKLALYGTRRDFLNAMAQGHSPTGVSPQDDSYLQELSIQSPPTQTVPETVIQAPTAIDPEIQNMLNHILDDQIVPLRSDGILGPQTKDALKKFIAKYGPATKTNIKNVFDRLNSQPVDLTDAAKQRDYLALHPDEASGLKLRY